MKLLQIYQPMSFHAERNLVSRDQKEQDLRFWRISTKFRTLEAMPNANGSPETRSRPSLSLELHVGNFAIGNCHVVTLWRTMQDKKARLGLGP